MSSVSSIFDISVCADINATMVFNNDTHASHRPLQYSAIPHTINSTVTKQCETGYALYPDDISTLICGEDGEFSPSLSEFGVCKVAHGESFAFNEFCSGFI
jgi:hypothetical protein